MYLSNRDKARVVHSQSCQVLYSDFNKHLHSRLVQRHEVCCVAISPALRDTSRNILIRAISRTAKYVHSTLENM